MKKLTTLFFVILLTAGCSATGQVQADDDYFTQAELDSLLAPVALYPDSVLSHVLIAATYPLEVIQAARFAREHPGLRGEHAVAAVEHYDWDPSVKALVAFPELLRRMDADLDWTQDLGDAFLLQEADVIASIQYLRSEAYSRGHLSSNDHVRVVREREYIYIEPARTRVIYVPYYDPRVIYADWRWSAYRPHYWHRPSGFSLSVNFHWGRPYHVRPSFYFSSFHWPTHRVVVVNHHHYYRNHRFHSGRQVASFDHARHWKHDPKHRRGVSYRGRVEQARLMDDGRPASSRVKSHSAKGAVARSDRRDWAAARRSSMSFDRQAPSRKDGSSRSQRVAELRGSRGDKPAVSRGSSKEARSTVRRGRVESRKQAQDGQRALSGGSRNRPPAASSSRSPGRSTPARANRSDSKRSSVAIPRDLTVRSTGRRDRPASAPSKGAGAGRGSTSGRESLPSRGRPSVRSVTPSRSVPRQRPSAPSRSESSSRSATPSRSVPRQRLSAPNRSSEPRAPTRSVAPKSAGKASAPARSQRATSRKAVRSSGSNPRSRDGRGGDDRR